MPLGSSPSGFKVRMGINMFATSVIDYWLKKHCSTFVLLAAFISSIQASFGSELARGTHIYGVLQTVLRCPGMADWERKYSAVRIYRSTKNQYFTYLLNKSGTEFGPKGGIRKDEFEGNELTSRLQITESGLAYKLRLRHPKVTVKYEADITVASHACIISRCLVSVEPLPNGCVQKCQAEGCEVRNGPPS
jgi:hypothetical protein